MVFRGRGTGAGSSGSSPSSPSAPSSSSSPGLRRGSEGEKKRGAGSGEFVPTLKTAVQEFQTRTSRPTRVPSITQEQKEAEFLTQAAEARLTEARAEQPKAPQTFEQLQARREAFGEGSPEASAARQAIEEQRIIRKITEAPPRQVTEPGFVTAFTKEGVGVVPTKRVVDIEGVRRTAARRRGIRITTPTTELMEGRAEQRIALKAGDRIPEPEVGTVTSQLLSGIGITPIETRLGLIPKVKDKLSRFSVPTLTEQIKRQEKFEKETGEEIDIFKQTLRSGLRKKIPKFPGSETLVTTGAGLFAIAPETSAAIVTAGGRAAIVGRSFISEPKETILEVGRATKEFPRELLETGKQFNPLTPEGRANILLFSVFIAKGGQSKSQARQTKLATEGIKKLDEGKTLTPKEQKAVDKLQKRLEKKVKSLEGEVTQASVEKIEVPGVPLEQAAILVGRGKVKITPKGRRGKPVKGLKEIEKDVGFEIDVVKGKADVARVTGIPEPVGKQPTPKFQKDLPKAFTTGLTQTDIFLRAKPQFALEPKIPFKLIGKPKGVPKTEFIPKGITAEAIAGKGIVTAGKQQFKSLSLLRDIGKERVFGLQVLEKPGSLIPSVESVSKVKKSFIPKDIIKGTKIPETGIVVKDVFPQTGAKFPRVRFGEFLKIESLGEVGKGLKIGIDIPKELKLPKDSIFKITDKKTTRGKFQSKPFDPTKFPEDVISKELALELKVKKVTPLKIEPKQKLPFKLKGKILEELGTLPDIKPTFRKAPIQRRTLPRGRDQPGLPKPTKEQLKAREEFRKGLDISEGGKQIIQVGIEGRSFVTTRPQFAEPKLKKKPRLTQLEQEIVAQQFGAAFEGAAFTPTIPKVPTALPPIIAPGKAEQIISVKAGALFPAEKVAEKQLSNLINQQSVKQISETQARLAQRPRPIEGLKVTDIDKAIQETPSQPIQIVPQITEQRVKQAQVTPLIGKEITPLIQRTGQRLKIVPGFQPLPLPVPVPVPPPTGLLFPFLLPLPKFKLPKEITTKKKKRKEIITTAPSVARIIFPEAPVFPKFKGGFLGFEIRPFGFGVVRKSKKKKGKKKLRRIF